MVIMIALIIVREIVMSHIDAVAIDNALALLGLNLGSF